MLVKLKRSFYSADGVLYIDEGDGAEVPLTNVDGTDTVFPETAEPVDRIAHSLLKRRVAAWQLRKETKGKNFTEKRPTVNDKTQMKELKVLQTTLVEDEREDDE